jgi:hypothetical protein
VPRPTITTHPVADTDTGHLTEFLYDDGGNKGTLVCAAHAGDVEPGTGEQAVELATRLGATCWACFGYDDGGAFEAFHRPTRYSTSSPARSGTGRSDIHPVTIRSRLGSHEQV